MDLIRLSLGVLLLIAPASAADLRIGVDPRVELMSIIFRLAGSSEYSQGRVPAYNEAIDRHFARFKDHEAVRMAAALRRPDGVSYDAVMSMAVQITDADTLDERMPFDSPESLLDKRWHGAKSRKFLEAARQFVKDTGFKEFLKGQQPLYELTDERLREAVASEIDLPWFDKFFGQKAEAQFVVVPGLANGGGSYGSSARREDGGTELYAILGVWRVDSAGNPTFPKESVGTLVHEFAHSYANPLIEKFAKQMDGAAAQINAPVKQAMQAQAYGSPRTLLYESLVRASTARYILAHGGADSAKRAVQSQQAASFLWMPGLFELLGEYEQGRQKYPSLESFMPEVVRYFSGLAPKIGAMVRDYEDSRPKVASMTPANGARDVDPAVQQIVIRFDRPMRLDSYAVTQTRKDLYPKTSNPRFDERGTVFTIDVELQPGRDYELGLNWPNGGSFVSREGIPLKFVQIRFRTGAVVGK